MLTLSVSYVKIFLNLFLRGTFMNNENKKRLDYVDWAKAICISLIIIGHILPSGCWPKTLMYTFHVPMFALVGGVLFSAPKNMSDLGKKLLGILKRMVIPYAIWFAISASLYYLSVERIPDIVRWSAKLVDGVTTLDFKQFIKFFFFYENSTLWNDPLWFMPCYIILSILFLLFTMISRGNKIASGALAVISFSTLLILEKLGITINIGEVTNVFGMKNYFLLLGFLATGHAIRPLLDKCLELFESPTKNPILYISGFIFFLTSIISLIHNEYKYPGGYFPLSLYSASYNDFNLYIIFSFILSISLLVFLMLLPKSKVANLLSKNSLFIMCTHYFFFTFDMTFHFLTKNGWKDVAQKLEIENWELSMNLGFRDAVFIIVVYIVLLLIIDAIQQKLPKISKVTAYIGLK